MYKRQRSKARAVPQHRMIRAIRAQFSLEIEMKPQNHSEMIIASLFSYISYSLLKLRAEIKIEVSIAFLCDKRCVRG